MNLSSDDNSLQLLKYLPDMASHFLLQPTDSLDLGQLPGLCDDLLTNGLDLGTGWTVGNLTLPILLSTPTITEPETTTTLGINGTLLESLEKPKECVELDKTEVKNVESHIESIAIEKTIEPTESTAPNTIQTFLSEQNITSSPVNNTIVLHIPENITTQQKRKIKASTKNAKSKKAKVSEAPKKRVIKKVKKPPLDTQNVILQNLIGENGTIETVAVSDNCMLDGKQIIEICSDNIVDIDSLGNNLLITNPISVEKKPKNDTININDVATVITAYQCKNCEFSCNDEDVFLEHYKEVHKNGESENVSLETIENNTTFNNLRIETQTETETAENGLLFTLYLQEDDNFMLDKQKQIIVEGEEVENSEEVLQIIKVEDENNTVQIEDVGSEDEGVHLYICSQCGQGGFESIDAVRNHMIEVHELQSLDETQKIKTENETLSIVVSAEEIKKRNKMAIDKFLTTDVMKSRKNKCTIKGCQYRFAKPELLARHVKCHVDGAKNQFHCPECNQHFQAWRTCSMHLWNCHRLDLDLYTCPLCEYRTTTPMKLTIHLKIHSDDKEFACPDCGRRFKQASQMRNHRVIHLDKELHGIPKWYAQKHCDKCGKDFADAKCLKKHVQAVHSRLKPFICNVCGHSCARKAMLEMHVRQHTGEKPYACQTCYYRTGDHNSLRRHMMRHSGERPYKCPHCSYTAIQSNSYKNHLASKHPGMAGIFACNICNFRCVNEELFTSHLNEHEKGLIDKTGKRPPPEIIDKNKTVVVDTVTSDTSSSKSSEDDRPETSTSTFNSTKPVEAEDEETQHFLSSLGLREDHTVVDTGGITIPADP